MDTIYQKIVFSLLYKKKIIYVTTQESFPNEQLYL